MVIPVQSYKIFISHGSSDSWIARQMGKRIQDDCGALTFLDVEQIASGDNFKDRIHMEIREASELVALFTPWSAQRAWVWIEVGAAWVQGKRVIAVLHGMTASDFEKLSGGKGVFEDLHIIQLNDFDRYIVELNARVRQVANA
jgi:hypothetical protein